MSGSNGSTVRASLGIILTTIKPPQWLRFCPLCAKDDKEKFGWFYWHRLHQVSGVEVCPTHNIFLENSEAPTRDRYNPYSYISAERAIRLTSPRPLNLNDYAHQTLIALAEDAAWLLNQKNPVPGFRALHSGFTNALTEMGLTTFRHKKRQDILLKFSNLYSCEMLKSLQCSFDGQKPHNWVSRIINNLNQGKAHHPLRYLLLIRFAGHTAESFFTMCNGIPLTAARQEKPFGCGPWPCLNPVCKYFRSPRIKDCRIRTTKKPSSTLGIFSCSCGFVYSRRGASSSADKVSSNYHVRAYGHLWESHLRRYWKDPKLSLRQIGKKLGVNNSTIKHHAVRLGLQVSVKRISPVSPSLKKRLQKAQNDAVRKRKDCREHLLLAMKKHPTANRTRLRSELLPTGIYNWLLLHDREWAEGILPPQRRLGRPRTQTNDGTYDLELSSEIRRSAGKLKNAPGRPVRVTKSAIGKDINKVRDFYDNRVMARFPLAAKALTESVETRIDFAIRRILWAAECFRQENVSPSWTRLPKRAALDHDIWYVPEVEVVIDDAWLSLQQPPTKIAVEAA